MAGSMSRAVRLVLAQVPYRCDLSALVGARQRDATKAKEERRLCARANSATMLASESARGNSIVWAVVVEALHKLLA
jgi:hypothetical protein